MCHLLKVAHLFLRTFELCLVNYEKNTRTVGGASIDIDSIRVDDENAW